MPRACLLITVCLLGPMGLLVAETSGCAIDGVVQSAATGEPIVRAKVSLMGPAGQSASATDSHGRWSFTGIACGQMQIVATRSGYLQGSAGQPRLGATFRPLILTPDNAVHDVKIALTPQAVVTGKVVDEQGDPMMNVQISAVAPKVTNGRRTFQTANITNTNDLGEFRLSGLQPGRYTVCAHAPPANVLNGPPGQPGATVIASSCYPGPPETGSAGMMDIRGTDTRVDFTLRLVPAVRIRGSLQGAPRGAGISLVRPDGGMSNRPVQGAVRPDGVFEISGVTPGPAMLTSDFFEGGTRWAARVPIDVGGTDIEGVVVRLEQGFSISGVIRMEAKQSGAGQPQPNPNLSLRPSNPASIGGGQFVWNKEAGTFTINQVLPGNYQLDLFGGGPYYIKSATLGGRDILHDEIPLTAGAGPMEVVISDDVGSLDGRVEDADGKPMAAWVMLLQAGRAPRTVMSSEEGKFTLAGLAPGDYTASAWDDWTQVEYANAEWMRRNASVVTVSIEPGQTANVKLRPQAAPLY